MNAMHMCVCTLIFMNLVRCYYFIVLLYTQSHPATTEWNECIYIIEAFMLSNNDGIHVNMCRSRIKASSSIKEILLCSINSAI